MAITYMTKEGYNKKMQEIAYLETVKRPEISAAIAEARDKGDLSENSEYDAAKEEQSHNESRINEIRQILSVATVVAAGSHFMYSGCLAPDIRSPGRAWACAP